MADVETQAPRQPDTELPEYLTDSNATLRDKEAVWRYGSAPDYSKTRKVYEETKSMNHKAGSLPNLVENLVKNWEVEASFKPRLKDWRTIDAENYSFAINGGKPQTAEHMLKVGTYNAIIAPNDYYSPEHSDFASSHKTFKRMMPTFAWEVLEVYSGPPHVSFRWRHWGTMKNDYVGFNDKGEKITAKANGQPIDVQGVTVATVDEKVRLQRVETWFDPMEMFRQIAPDGIVNRQTVAERANSQETHSVSTKHENMTSKDNDDMEGVKAADPVQAPKTEPPLVADFTFEKAVDERSQTSSLSDSSSWTSVSDSTAIDKQLKNDEKIEASASPAAAAAAAEAEAEAEAAEAEAEPPVPSIKPSQPSVSDVSVSTEAAEASGTAGTAMNSPITYEDKPMEYEEQVKQLEASKADGMQPASADGGFMTGQHADVPKDVEDAVLPAPGEAVVAPATGEEARKTHEEMSRVTAMECPFLMNQE